VYEIPCPHCQTHQVPEFEQLRWELDEAGRVVPASVVLRCAGCGEGISARERGAMLRAGRWRATAEPRVPHKRTFHLTGLVAAFGSWEELAQEFVTANGQADQAIRAEMLRAFFNTALGLLYRDQSAETVKSALVARALPYSPDGSWQVPQQVGVLTAGVDIQHDRAEVVVRGWGAGEESWLIARAVLRGDAFQPSFWTQLEEWRSRKEWRHESGATLGIRAMCIDASDGAVAKSVYEYAAPRLGAGVFAIKGHGSPTAPMTPTKPTKVKPGRLYLLGVHAIMERLYRRLGMTAPGPGYLHLNEYAGETPPDGVPADYVEQLTAMERKRDEKTRKYRYVARKGVRNEVADAETYAYAALLLGPVPRDLLAQEVVRVNAQGAAARQRRATPDSEPVPTPAPVPRKTSTWLPSRGRGWR
jgi:phage terminase large subunit GpA-like protein